MANYMVNINMQVNASALQLTLAPFVREVPKGDHVVIWRCGVGVQFPDTDYFAWKPGSVDTPGIPTRSTDGKMLTLAYNNGPSTPNWSYTIKVQDANDTTLIVTIDPDIDNDPPSDPPED